MSVTIQNFGANQVWQPRAFFAPTSEAELLALLRQYRGHNFRAIGRMHSWSNAIVGTDVLLDLRNLNGITIHTEGDSSYVEVGAGCQLKRLLSHLTRFGYTLPSLGLIDEQTVAGATATATHGSGKNSLSHYIQAARIACYDLQTREPIIRTIDSGPELQAVRCAVGCMGIITSLRFEIRKQYHVEEFFAGYPTLDAVLAQEANYPIQQFYFLPWRWDFFAQHRREVDQPTSLSALLYRLYWVVGMDVGLHIIVRMLVRLLPRRITKLFFRRVLTLLVPRPWRVVDRSDRQLTMQHELFRHIEIEIFVKRSHLAEAIWVMRDIIERHADSGGYLHHYPICVRKVFPDDTLISMTAGWDEPGYALSFISYAKPNQREGFFAFAYELATTLATHFDARPHWGKYNPLPPEELRRLYPQLPEFAKIVNEVDADGVFQNEWMKAILGFYPERVA